MRLAALCSLALAACGYTAPPLPPSCPANVAIACPYFETTCSAACSLPVNEVLPDGKWWLVYQSPDAPADEARRWVCTLSSTSAPPSR